MSYIGAERFVAASLNRCPRIKDGLKRAYAQFNLMFKKPARRVSLAPGVSLERVDKADDRPTFWGYYDKPAQNTNGMALYHKVPVGASPQNGRPVEVWQTDGAGRSTKLAESCAWNWQQGCMLTWVDDDTFVFNDYDAQAGRYIARLRSLDGVTQRTLNMPVYTVSGHKAVSLSFTRLAKLRPDYGYFRICSGSLDDCPDDDGVWYVDLKTGDTDLILSLEQIAAFKHQPTMLGAIHKVNHLQFSPNGDRFNFLHRWYRGNIKRTRLLSVSIAGSDLRELLADEMVSHCAWVDNDRIICWARRHGVGDRYYLVDDRGDSLPVIVGEGALREDGHPSILGGEHMLTDSYPDRSRLSSLLHYQLESQQSTVLGRFYSPMRYWGTSRCDLHPRWNPDGSSLTFDSTHDGVRRLYRMRLEEGLLQS